MRLKQRVALKHMRGGVRNLCLRHKNFSLSLILAMLGVVFGDEEYIWIGQMKITTLLSEGVRICKDPDCIRVT